MSNWTFGHLDIWNVQGLGLIYIIIIIIIIINYYFYQNRHLDELKSPKVQKSDLYKSHFCAFTGIAIRASMPPMMSIFIFFFIISVYFINKVVSVNVNDCEQLWFDPVA